MQLDIGETTVHAICHGGLSRAAWLTWRNIIPYLTVKQASEILRPNVIIIIQDAAYIIWTGDVVPHDNWSTDKKESLMISKRLLDLMKEYFPDTPIFATLGNHDSHPVNT